MRQTETETKREHTHTNAITGVFQPASVALETVVDSLYDTKP